MCGICGICGIYNFTNKKINIKDKLIRMNKLLEHRGPDGNGIWINTTENIGLSHIRLSIIDLNNRSKQPMVFNNYVITFNGEIYNYDVLKKDLLSSWNFNTDSDTGVILALYHKYKDKCVDFLDGMFSFVIYNINTNVIFCARDRLGIKPFYYFIEDNVFYFASEIKALLPNLLKVKENIEGIGEYLIFQYPISEITMFKKIKQLLPSHILKINSEKSIKITKYWNLDYINKITDSLNDLPIRLDNNGNSSRDFIYVSDLVEGLIACALKGKNGGVYNLASGQETTIGKLAKEIIKQTNSKSELNLQPPREWDHSGRRFGDPTKAKKEIYFECKVKFEDGIKNTVEWTKKKI